MSITGNSTGSNREAIIKEAIATTSTYYGTDCVNVALSNERTDGEFSDISGIVISRTFTADWEGCIEHRWDGPFRGFPKCYKCGKRGDR